VGFAPEPLIDIRIVAAVIREDFQRHDAVQSLVAGAIDLSHPARTER
jgi:hypothetical protein